MESTLRDGATSGEKHLEAAIQVFDFASTARRRFAEGDPETQKEILIAIASNLTLINKRLRFEARKPFFFPGDSLSPATDENDGIGPENTGSAYGSNGQNPSAIPRLRGLRQDVRTYERRTKGLVRSVYRFFEKRASCGCKDCRDEFLNPLRSILHRNRRRRWNVLPERARICVYKNRPGL